MLNRSLSFSEFPARKRASTKEEEGCSASGLPMIKRYSCEQISYSGEKIKIQRIVQELGICNDKVSSFKSCAVKYEGPASSLKKYCENINSLPTKDVPDLCLQQKGKMETRPEPEANIKPLSLPVRNLTGKIFKRRKNTKASKIKNSSDQGENYILFIFLPLIFVVTAGIVCRSLYLASYQRVCEMTLDIGAVRTVLENNIFGQKDAVYDIMSVLNTFYSTRDPGIVILAFVGGTGVGKSYTTSVISKLFPWEENVQHFVRPLHSSSLAVNDVYAKFSPCGDNLVVMEDLVTSGAVNIAEFLQNLVKRSQSRGIRAIVILVFNNEDQKVILQGNGDVEHQFQVIKEKLSSIFQDAELEVSFITFQPLQSEHVAMCIKEAVNWRGIAWLNTEVEEVMALLPQGTGCKGVASKVQLLREERVTSTR
jgi:hypothetical protein